MIKIEILSVRNPQWVNDEHNAINCLIRTNTLRQEVLFTASPYDPEPHGREIFTRCVAGEYGEIASIEPKSPQQSLPPLSLPVKYHRLKKFLLEANKENSRKSFRSVVIVWGSMLDNLLDEMLEFEALRTVALGNNAGKPPKTFSARIDQAFNVGLIDQQEAEKCHRIRQVRNEVAHEWDLSLATKNLLPSLRALYEADHSDLLVFHEDLEFLLQQVYSSSCAMLMMRFFDRLGE
ncbi:DUF4145 domain-containing protein [Budvicia diplopodorum]|uniref:DUF4145 domain-containing protein n=1 Tax=Budvicia diplopodorum TaxID=1119056 RepID=UPI00135879EE|nr:DUF4145 domain-containing protein [Budvicia diplopodorum]